MPLPDFPKDLNACHKMEKTLTTNQMEDYAGHLCVVAVGVSFLEQMENTQRLFALAHAAPHQRCKAFLLTVGQWDDSK